MASTRSGCVWARPCKSWGRRLGLDPMAALRVTGEETCARMKHMPYGDT